VARLDSHRAHVSTPASAKTGVSCEASLAARAPSAAGSVIALFKGAHDGNTAATATVEFTTLAPGESFASDRQHAISVSCPGSGVA
jgi:hypothetical protein